MLRFASLLSTVFDERFMLEDMMYAVNLLNRVSFRLVKETPGDAMPITIEGTRAALTVSVHVHAEVFDRLPSCVQAVRRIDMLTPVSGLMHARQYRASGSPSALSYFRRASTSASSWPIRSCQTWTRPF